MSTIITRTDLTDSAVIDKFDEIKGTIMDTNTEISNVSKKMDDHISKFNKYKDELKLASDEFISKYDYNIKNTEYRLNECNERIHINSSSISVLKNITDIRYHVMKTDNDICDTVKIRGNTEFVSHVYFSVPEIVPLMNLIYRDRGFITKIIGEYDMLMISWSNPPVQVIVYKIKTFIKNIMSKIFKKKSK